MALSGLPNILHDIQSRDSWQQRCQYLVIVKKWSDIVGESVAKQTCLIGLYQKVLQVAVSNPVWSQALTFERLRILAKVNALLEGANTLEIVDIHFSTAKWATHQQVLAQIKVVNEDHPSYLPALFKDEQNNNLDNLNTGKGNKSSSQCKQIKTPVNPPTNASEAFERWQSVMKLRTNQLPKCPQCDRPALTGELSRWQMCRVCAIVHLFK